MIRIAALVAALAAGVSSAFADDYDYAYLDRAIATVYADFPTTENILQMQQSLGFQWVTATYRIECPTCQFSNFYFCQASTRYAAILIWQYPEGITFQQAEQLATEYSGSILHCNRILPGETAPSSADSVCPFEAVGSPAWLPADINYDCKVNIIDLLCVRNRIGTDPAQTSFRRADVNRDGMINILDLIAVRKQLCKHCDGISTQY